jgi:hypothetical protein
MHIDRMLSIFAASNFNLCFNVTLVDKWKEVWRRMRLHLRNRNPLFLAYAGAECDQTTRSAPTHSC